MRKISLIGAGQIGSQLAIFAAQQHLGEEIILFDVKEGLPQGKALDIAQCLSCSNIGVKIIGTNEIEQIRKSDVIIITAGIPRKPGMTRQDLIQTNAAIIKDLAEKIKQNAPGAFIIMITNPLDIMTLLMLKFGKFRKNQVVGMAGELDSSRFQFFLSEALNVHPQSIQTMVLGSHSNEMAPMISLTSIAGIPLQNFIDAGHISQQKVNEIIERTRVAGGEIVKNMGSSAYKAPAACAIKMAKSYLQDQSLILPACAYLENEYGFNEICGGVPVKINREGVRVVNIKLSEKDTNDLNRSLQKIKDIVDTLEEF